MAKADLFADNLITRREYRFDKTAGNKAYDGKFSQEQPWQGQMIYQVLSHNMSFIEPQGPRSSIPPLVREKEQHFVPEDRGSLILTSNISCGRSF
jgi:hypothetical protein